MKDIATCFVFASSSDPSRTYQALLYVDGSTSCECRGWTLRAVRSCRHTRSIETGCADREAIKRIDYAKTRTQPIIPPLRQAKAERRSNEGARSKRFFDLET